jgi:hypothetical protein
VRSGQWAVVRGAQWPVAVPAVAADLEVGIDGVAGTLTLAALEETGAARPALEERRRHGHARVYVVLLQSALLALEVLVKKR